MLREVQQRVDRVFVETLRRNFAGVIKELPHHINDAGFAEACLVELAALLPES